jgi:GSH-dependent disulfide-bond oxidoreductase
MIDLYTAGTGNGYRAAIVLAESGLPHRVHKVDLAKGESKTPEFLERNPAGAIPVLVDSEGPGGKELTLAQSGAIALYLAEKSGKFLPKDAARRAIALQWFMQATTDVAPGSGMIFMSGSALPDKSPANTAFFENRLVGILRNCDRQLRGQDYLAGELSVADLALYPVVATRKAMIDKAGDLPDLTRWAAAMAARPGVQRGMKLPD